MEKHISIIYSHSIGNYCMDEMDYGDNFTTMPKLKKLPESMRSFIRTKAWCIIYFIYSIRSIHVSVSIEERCQCVLVFSLI